MPHVHIAHRVDYNTILNNPEQILQQMSFKIFEKRSAVFEQMIGTKLRFRKLNGIEQGICQSIHAEYCIVKVGDVSQKVSLHNLIL
jgi:hypothetical protein